MSRTVLDVGQCVPDHASIRRFLEKQFDVKVEQTDALEDTLRRLRENAVDLVLINRRLDVDYSDGIEILKAIKADSALAALPVMLVTNYPDHQQAAVDAGGEPGFGKDSLHAPQTLERLRRFLA